MEGGPLPEPDVIIPNLNRRFSGVTAANRAMAPRLMRRHPIAWFGTYRPAAIQGLSINQLLALRSRDRPVVWHARRNVEMVLGVLLRALGWPLRLLFTSAAQRHHTWFTRWLIARMDGVIAASEAAASYLRRDAVVIRHGVDAELFRPPADRGAAFAAAGLPGRYAIGCFGRVRAQKGTDVFVAAMCRLLPLYPDFCAVIVGPVTTEQRPFEARLKAQAEQAGLADRIRFVGEVPADDLPAWYQRILIYAFTSRTEGFGLTLLEAMASGAALVAARAGAAEVVVTEGETGVLVPPGDVDALVRALEPLMRDPSLATAMGARARGRIIAEFSVEAEAERIADVYRGLLA